MKLLYSVAILLAKTNAQQPEPATTAQNFATNINGQALASQKRCEAIDNSNTNFQKGTTKPNCFQGYSLANTFGVYSGQGSVSAVVVDCVDGTWCRKRSTGELRSCSLRGTEQANGGGMLLSQSCVDIDRCDQFENNPPTRVYQACPNHQCPAYMFRSGIANIERRNGKLVYKRTGCSNNMSQAMQRRQCEAEFGQDVATQNPSQLNGYSPVFAPFQCIYKECSRQFGYYISKGNTDTGPTNHLSGASQIIIEPYWSGGISSYNEQASDRQGRCKNCQTYEASTDAQEIMVKQKEDYDSKTQQLKAGRSALRSVGKGSLGCYRCPEWQRRNTNTGNCGPVTCNGLTEIVVARGAQQGQCQQCRSNSIPDQLRRVCNPCAAGETVQTRISANGQQEAYCGSIQCNGARSILQNGRCINCGDFQCAMRNGGNQRCYNPVCQPGEIVQRDCTCYRCPVGSEPDAGQRSCSTAQCPPWTRRQQNTGQCASDACGPRQWLYRDGFNQGQCQQCPDYEVANFDQQSCAGPQCPRNNMAVDTNGQCYDCQAGATVSPDRRQCYYDQCPPYTRRQVNQGNQCAPDVCGSFERNVRIDETIGGILNQQGMCVRCSGREQGSSPDINNSNARTTCQGVACGGNSIITSSGQCEPCPLCESPDQTQSRCLRINCVNRDFLSITNDRFNTNNNQQTCQCATCPNYETPNTDRRGCTRTVCPRDQYIDIYGQCQSCGGPRFFQNTDGTSCDSVNCQNNQYWDTANNRCASCPAYQCLDRNNFGSGNNCYAPVCNANQRVLENCSLVTCDPYTKSTGTDCRSCVKPVCKGREFLSSDGNCYPCEDYTIPDPRNKNRDRCVIPSCAVHQIVTRIGGCQNCPSGKNPDFTQRACIDMMCTLRQRKVIAATKTTCVDCPIRQRAQNDWRTCGPDPCAPTRRKYTLDDGTCYACGDFLLVNTARDNCVEPKCPANAVVQRDATCKVCKPYWRRVEFNDPNQFRRSECQECQCFGREYCLTTGTCKLCPDFQIPRADGKGCMRPKCPQLVTKDGGCDICPDYNYWDTSSKTQPAQCRLRVCPARQKVLRNGTCELCPSFFRVSTNKRDCDACNCPADKICTATGICKPCPDFELVQSTGPMGGKECYRPSCGPAAVLKRDGSCNQCKSCEKLNSSKTACIRPKCDSRSVIQTDGTCLKCQEYTAPVLFDKDQCGAYCQGCDPTSREIILQNGKCQKCPDYNKISDNFRKCTPVVCKVNEIKTIEGYCSPCPEGTKPDPLGRECKGIICKPNQILKINKCENCPRYNRPDLNSRVCIQDPCDSTQKVDDLGKCVACGACQRTQPPRYKCFADTCDQKRQILLNDGTCQNCEPYYVPKSVKGTAGQCGRVCQLAVCPKGQIVMEDGTCQSCPEWTRPMDGNRVCGPEVCGVRERLTRTGTCVPCDGWTRGNGQQQKGQYIQCLPDKCDGNQILKRDGTCGYCGPYEKADETKKKCYTPPCGDRTRKLLQDATFKKCPDYTRATEDCKACAADACTLRQKLLQNGTCQNCPDYQRATPDGKGCRRYPCEKNQILLRDGTCQDCPAFQRAKMTDDKNQKIEFPVKCYTPICTNRQRLLPSGECEDCEAYTRALNDGKACAPNLCTSRQKVLENGTCQDCPAYTRAFANGRECANEVCTARQILQIDGRCADCYPYTRAAKDGKVCVPHNCNDRQKLGPEGTCIDCPFYERAQGTGLSCGPDTCNIRQRVLKDGTCKYCPLYESVCANRRCCSRPTCKPQIEYISKDGVCQQCAFHQMTGPDGTSCRTDPTKKLPDPQIPAPTPVTVEATQEPGRCTTAGCDVWTDEQFLSEDQATGFYLDQRTGNLGFILGNAMRLSTAAASLFTAVLIALNAY